VDLKNVQINKIYYFDKQLMVNHSAGQYVNGIVHTNGIMPPRERMPTTGVLVFVLLPCVP
jgi:hypothetical protein